MLDAYQQHFRTVENNGTHHRMPDKDAVLAWKSRCGPKFQMSVKMVRTVTHSGSNNNNGGNSKSDDGGAIDVRALRAFADSVALLGSEHLGPILIQFPRTRVVTPRLLREAARVLRRESDLPADARVAVEIRQRHADPESEREVLDALRELRWCLVVHPNTVGRSTVVREKRDGTSASHGLEAIDAGACPITAGDWVYVRLHGANDEHTGSYSDDDLRRQAVPAIVSWLRRGIDVYAYILCDNDDDGCDSVASMPHNAKRLEELCYEKLGMSVPKPPKHVPSIASFFAVVPKKKSTNEGKKTDEGSSPTGDGKCETNNDAAGGAVVSNNDKKRQRIS